MREGEEGGREDVGKERRRASDREWEIRGRLSSSLEVCGQPLKSLVKSAEGKKEGREKKRIVG